MTEEEILNKCKERFAAHKATLIQDTDRYMIIDWRKADGSIDYYVNYILDKKRGSLIISGDLGDCIATWYDPVKPNELRCEINSTRNHDVKLMLALRCIELMTGEEGFERRNLNE